MTNDPASGSPGSLKTWPHGAAKTQPASAERELELRSYLRDYTALIAATPYPSLLLDRAWNVLAANSAYEDLFREVRDVREPAALRESPAAAMPGENLLRFVLFHPDAGAVLREHETGWCLPLLAQFSAALDAYGQDATLRGIREDIARDPLMNAAYQQGLPRWMHSMGPAALDHDGAVRGVRHPDPEWGRTTCRVVTDSPGALRERGLTRLTLILHAPGRRGEEAGRPEAAAPPHPTVQTPPRLRVVRPGA
ncbi:MmyB family transcriptional regulator [Streptomyces cavernicola]|uniref:MmyB-like transcription regulator ligand binding domain-containing protein n=1 Tax=Streptomyces cavernicola TaxID=3043613 RepID=A0ABT6SAI6_9ACTN|nr:hypothetical protein [Streptomyces sp. B-S-A6]MDI3404794.1 hypothetical protein [Streptomyces sp. B-S-A6]